MFIYISITFFSTSSAVTSEVSSISMKSISPSLSIYDNDKKFGSAKSLRLKTNDYDL